MVMSLLLWQCNASSASPSNPTSSPDSGDILYINICIFLLQVEEGVRLARGDVVSMVVTFNPRTGERGGQRVRLLRQGDKDAAKPEFVAERNPNAVRYVGNRAVRPDTWPPAQGRHLQQAGQLPSVTTQTGLCLSRHHMESPHTMQQHGARLDRLSG
jgi:hypothetical protein